MAERISLSNINFTKASTHAELAGTPEAPENRVQMFDKKNYGLISVLPLSVQFMSLSNFGNS